MYKPKKTLLNFCALFASVTVLTVVVLQFVIFQTLITYRTSNLRIQLEILNVHEAFSDQSNPLFSVIIKYGQQVTYLLVRYEGANWFGRAYLLLSEIYTGSEIDIPADSEKNYTQFLISQSESSQSLQIEDAQVRMSNLGRVIEHVTAMTRDDHRMLMVFRNVVSGSFLIVLAIFGLAFLVWRTYVKPSFILMTLSNRIASNPMTYIAPSQLESLPNAANKGYAAAVRRAILSLMFLRESLNENRRYKKIGMAVAQLTHDIRNMLASVMLIAEVIETENRSKQGSKTDPEQSEQLKKSEKRAQSIVNIVERGTEMCQGLMDFVRSKDKPTIDRIERCDLRAVLQEARGAFEFGYGDSVQFIDQGEFLAIYADHRGLVRVFDNLFRNAVEAGATQLTTTVRQADSTRMRALLTEAQRGVSQLHTTELQDLFAETQTDRELRLDAEVTEAKFVCISVSDNGKGIESAAVNMLFSHYSFTSKASGNGLGLSICQELIENMGGYITLGSQESTGTCFELYLQQASGSRVRRKPA